VRTFECAFKHIFLALFIALILTATGSLIGASPLTVPTGTWIATGPMNSARSGAAAVLMRDGRMLITGGSDSNGPSRTSELFGSNGSFSLAASMNVPRSGHVAVVMQDGRVLVAGGVTSGGAATSTAEIFDPIANSWTNVTGGMMEARSSHTAALLRDGRVLIAGGNNGTLISSTVERFDPTLGRFTAAGTMSSPRTQHAMTVLADGRVLIVGGSNGTAPIASSDIFDPVAGRVSAGPSLSVARIAHSATTLLNGLVVVIGGNNGNANPAQMDVTPAELFDPTAATPAFTTLASNLATPREGHLAFLLPNNNNVLIVGGSSGGATVASAELFLPQQSTQGVWTYIFSSAGSMSTARGSASGAANQVSSLSSVAQANGVLLVAGGKDANGNALNSAELYGFATIQTDRSDYPPGTTVNITGRGWQPGETVKIQLVESPLLDTHGPYNVIADASGNISDRSFTTDEHDANIKFTLTAIGVVSRAQMTFTDSPPATVTLNNTNTPVAAFGRSSLSTPMSVTAGGSSTVAFATVWVDEGSGPAGTTFNVTATYGGQAMTSAGPTSYDYNYAPISSQVFYLVNPPTGTNTLAVNATASSGTIQEVVANLVSYNGVDQTTPVRPGTYQTLHSLNGATVGSFTATLASNANDLTLGTVEATYAFTSPASNQTVDGTASAYYKVGSDHATTAAASINDTWSFTNPWAFYAYSGFSIQATTVGNTPTLTYTANPVSRVYGAANPAFTGTVTGFAGTDTLANSTTGTLAFTTTATASSNAGNYAINGSGLASSTYTFAQAASNATALTITKATPTVTVTGGTFSYDGTVHPATATAVGIDGVTPVSGSFSFTYTPPGNSTVPVTAGTYSVTANFTSADPNYGGATGSGSILITPSTASSTVTLNNKNTPAAAFGSSSLSAPMTVNAGGTNTVAFATVWVDEGSGAAGTTFNVTATYGGRAMTSAGPTAYDYDYAPISSQVFYLINPPTGTNTLVINATASAGTIQEVVANLVSYNGVNQTTPVRPGSYQTLHTSNAVTVGSFTATIPSSINDLTLGAVEATYTFTSPASNQTVDGTTSAYYKVGSDHATNAAVSISDTWSFVNPWAFYAYVGFSIQPLSGPVLTYTATPASRTYGSGNPAFAGTVTGFVGTDTLANSTTGTLTFTSAATSSSNVGSYAINGSGLAANNGKYTFAQAASNATALAVTPATLTYTANAASRTYGAANPTLTGTVAGFLGTDTQASATTGTIVFTSPATTTSNVGSYAINGSGLAANNGNYTFAQAPGNAAQLTVTQATPTIVVGGTYIFDGNPHAATATAVGADGHTPVNGSFTYIYTPSGTSTPPSSLGTYAVAAAFTSSDPNYANATGSGSMIITTVTPLTYTANPASRVYGAPNPAFTGTVTGFIGTDTQANSTSGTMTFISTATSASNVGSYPINGGGLTSNSGTYIFGQAAANATALTITKATPIITVTGGTFAYDSFPHAATATAVGADGITAVAGTFSFIYTPTGTSTPPTNLGTYAVSAIFTSTDSNYSNASGSGSITIGSPSTVTFNNKNTAVAALNSSSLSASMTVAPGGTGTVAFATVWVDEGSGSAGTTFNVTATYGGRAMTSAGPTSYDYNYAPISSQIFYLVNPPTGANTLVVNATASSGTIQEVVANLISFNGVNQTVPVRPGTYQTLHNSPGVTVGSFTAALASNVNDLTLGSVEATYVFTSPASNQTVDNTNAAYYKTGSDHGTSAAATVADAWSFTNPWAFYAYAGFSIQAANSGGRPTLTYTANPVTRTYGAANPAFSGTVTGFVGIDTQANATTGTLAFTSPATSTSGVGSYAINGSGLSAINYNLMQAPGNASALTITQATPTVTVGGTFAYDGTSHPAIATAIGADGVTPVSGTFSISYTPPGNFTAPISVGTYVAVATFTSSDPNYTNATATGTVNITGVNVTLNNSNAAVGVYGSSSFSKQMYVAPGGTNTVAFATVWVDEASGGAGTTFNVTATYGGQYMTSAGPTSYDYNYAPISSQVFYLVNPPTGTNTLTITATASSGTIQEIVANLVSYNGVNQRTPVRPGSYQTLHSANGATVGSFTATLTSNAYDLAMGAVEATYSFASPASNQTVDGTASAGFKAGSDHATTAASTISDRWSFTNPYAFYAYVGFSIETVSDGNSLSSCSSSGNPSYYQYQLNDYSNLVSLPFSRTTNYCDMMVVYAATQLNTASFTDVPTFSDGTAMSLCAAAACNQTTTNGSMNTRIWTGFSGGSTTPTFTNNLNVAGQTVGGVALEIAGVSTLDQIASSQLLNSSATTITSPTITTTHANEILLCLASEAQPIAGGAHFTNVSSPFTLITFGNQAIGYRIAPTPGTYSCTVTRAGGVQDETIAIAGFY
jgi:hypothetical protein